MLKKFLDGFDVIDMVLVVAFLYLLVATTQGQVVPDMIKNSNEWLMNILLFLLGKKTPNVISSLRK